MNLWLFYYRLEEERFLQLMTFSAQVETEEVKTKQTLDSVYHK